MGTSPFLGELMGTMVLVLLGDGVVANVLLSKSKGENSGWIVITAGWAFAVAMGVFVAGAFGSAAGHLNPAVTIGFAVMTGDYSLIPSFLTAQFIGAFIGGVLVWLHNLPHWAVTEDKGFKLGCFCTSPAIRSFGSNLISEIIGTAVLILGVFAIAVKGGAVGGLVPYLVGMLVWAIGLSLGGTTGYAINPARDLGPRIAHALLPIKGKGDSDWGYAIVPVLGPVIGAIIAALILKTFIH